jgi:hypothetical protein
MNNMTVIKDTSAKSTVFCAKLNRDYVACSKSAINLIDA